MGRRKRDQGRGWLSSIDRLPEEAQPIISWAAQELKDRKLDQQDIHEEFNQKLAELSRELGRKIGPISKSAFNRYAVSQAELSYRHDNMTKLTSVFAKRINPNDVDKTTLALVQIIKTLIFELLETAGEAGTTMKAAKEAADALRALTAVEKVTAARQSANDEKDIEKAAKEIAKVARANGLSAERVAQLRRDFLGLRK